MISEATFTALKQSQNQFGWKEGQRVCFFMANIFNRSSAQSSLSQKKQMSSTEEDTKSYTHYLYKTTRHIGGCKAG